MSDLSHLVVTLDAKSEMEHVKFKVSKNHEDCKLIEDISGSQNRDLDSADPGLDSEILYMISLNVIC